MGKLDISRHLQTMHGWHTPVDFGDGGLDRAHQTDHTKKFLDHAHAWGTDVDQLIVKRGGNDGLVIKNAPEQSEALKEWQDSAGRVCVNVTSSENEIHINVRFLKDDDHG